jgi:hypothetical protein
VFEDDLLRILENRLKERGRDGTPFHFLLSVP